MNKMIPLGYMYKRVEKKPNYFKKDYIVDIYSLSNCISKDFAEYLEYWKHNGHGLFNSPNIMKEIAKINNLDLASCTLFYYEGYELEYDDDLREWHKYEPDPDLETVIESPIAKNLHGFDVANYSMSTIPDCSPLSCNYVANEVNVNEHCLFRTFEEAKSSLESGVFVNTEPGPNRIIAVYTL